MDEKNYIEYVEEQLENIRDTSKLINEGQILPARLNYCIASYMETALMLQGEYQRLKSMNIEIEQTYQSWWDKKFLEARDKLNSDGRASSKYASKTEIESQTRVDNEAEYLKWKTDINDIESKKRYILKLIEMWKKQDGLLNTLSTNMRTEMSALYVGSSSWGGNRNPDAQTGRRKLKD